MTAPDLDPLQAYNVVMRFAGKRGPSALHLALHAAMPQVLRMELLHQIRVNFVPEAVGDLAVEADVLFAPFCEELGNGYYRFDPAARLLLLQELDPTYREKPRPRSERLASFLATYVERERLGEAAGLDPMYRDYLEVEGWVALGFFAPDSAAEQLARAVERQLSPERVAARVRIGGIAGALAIPLVSHRRVLAYAEGLDALDAGDAERGRHMLERAGDEEVRVGSVVLPSPAATL
jgi:hypothetical protein